MQQNVANLRGFFSAFFALEQPVWSGFLAGWPGLPGNENHEKWEKRLGFALGMFLNLPNEVRLRIILYAITFTLQYGPNVLLRSLTPSFLFGDGPPELEWSDSSNVSVGDEEAKQEARKMIKDFKPTKKSVVEVASNSTNAVSFVIPKEEKELALPAPFN